MTRWLQFLSLLLAAPALGQAPEPKELLPARQTRLRGIAATAGAGTVSAHTYAYDAFNRRTRATLADQSAWQYDYDDRNEVIGGRRFWADFNPVSGQQFGYAYDAQGNRSSATWGGDVNGGNPRTTSYSPNALNQYTAITTPGYLDVNGLAFATNAVTVNGLATDRKGESWHAQLGVANTNQPVWQGVATVSGTTTNSGFALVSPNSRSLAYDYDGNLTSDGRWNYTWDGENRLIELKRDTSTPTLSSRQRLVFEYDAQGRRIRKQFYTHNGTTWVEQRDTICLYDGWNVARIRPTPPAKAERVPEFAIAARFWELAPSGGT